MQDADADETTKIIREEFQKYSVRPFADTDDFVRDMRMHSDDLFVIAAELEKKFGLKIESRLYRDVGNIAQYAELIRTHQSAAIGIDAPTKPVTKSRAGLILLIINMFGAALYLWRASLGWRISEEHGVVRRDWNAGRVWVASAVIWLIAVGIDFANH